VIDDHLKWASAPCPAPTPSMMRAVSTGLDVAAIVISVAALGLSFWSAWSNRRSAGAAEDSAVSARQSADASRASSESAAKVAAAELRRDHRANEPQRNGRFVTRDGNLRYEFQLDKPYDIRARLSGHGGAVVNDVFPMQRSADGTWILQIGSWDRMPREEPWDTLTIRFWPSRPAAGAPDPWSCPCGLEEHEGDGPGHWQWSDIGIPQDRARVADERLS
jgi:hypothetical protein